MRARMAIEACREQFATYAKALINSLAHLLGEEPKAQRQAFVADSDRSTDFLLLMIGPFNVNTMLLRRMIRSCEGSACHYLHSGSGIVAIFRPGLQATLLDLLLQYTAQPCLPRLNEPGH